MSTTAPTYEDGQVMQITPRGTALARSVNGSISTSVEITLNTNTNFLRCYALSQDVYLRWGIEDCNANTFDEVIPAGQVVDLQVPFDRYGVKFTAFNIIERTTSATVIIIEK